jgi:beta-lactamase class A
MKVLTLFKTGWRVSLFPVFLFVCGLISGLLLQYDFSKTNPRKYAMSRSGGYTYINPLLTCDYSEDTEYVPYAPLKKSLQKMADDLIQQGAATRVSVYVRDMDRGNWTGVRSDDTFMPASLMKVPLLISLVKESSERPTFTSQKILLAGKDDINQQESIRSSNDLSLGSTYSLDTLINALIKQSDNNAARELLSVIPTSSLDDVFNEFNVSAPPTDASETMSPKQYMRFFRILYNASYLNRPESQRALTLLTKTSYDAGIPAGLPVGTVVAHKFGERTVREKNLKTAEITTIKNELHDCGIVYYARHPYGVCIMTEGKDMATLQNIIAQLSRAVYDAANAGILDK